jgi:flagellar protein FlaG
MDTALLSTLTTVSADPQPTSGKDQVTVVEPLGSPAVSPVPAKERPAVPLRLEAVAAQLEQFLNTSQRNVEIRVDADTHMQVVTVRDALTDQVIRQFPSEEVIRVTKNLNALQGALLNETV